MAKAELAPVGVVQKVFFFVCCVGVVWRCQRMGTHSRKEEGGSNTFFFCSLTWVGAIVSQPFVFFFFFFAVLNVDLCNFTALSSGEG